MRRWRSSSSASPRTGPRRRRTPPSPPKRRWPPDAQRVRHLPVGAEKAPRAEAHLPGPRRGGRHPTHLRHRARDPGRRAPGRRVRPLRPRHGPCDPAGPAAVRLDLDVSADHRAGRRRHRRGRGPPRHAQGDPHPLRRAPSDLRRQGPGRRELRDCRNCDHGRRRARRRHPRLGLQPDHEPFGNGSVRAARARPGRRKHARVPASDPRDRIDRAAAVDRPPQQWGGHRRHADVLAPPAARRHPPGPRPCTRTCSARSSTPGRGSCEPPSTGRRSCGRSGFARSTRCPR